MYMMKKLFALTSVFLLASCHASLNKMTLLRSPEKLSHRYTYEEVNEVEYLAFKEKMKLVSSKLSESLIKREFQEDKNVAFSPLSIELCLGLAVSASSGQTREELLSIFDMDYETFNKNYKTYFNQLSFERKMDEKILGQMLLTNSIWIDNDITLKDNGLDDLRDNYYCYSYHADFNGDNKNSNKAIQEFIKDKTKGLINPQLDFSPETLFVLLNTLYLKDIWNDLGDDLSYTNEPYKFVNRNGEESKKKLLEGYYHDGRTIYQDDYSCFYTGTSCGVKLYFVKPNEGKDLKNIFNKSSMDYVLNESNMVYQDDVKREIYHTKVIFPEYKAESNLDIRNVLKEDYNVKTLFDINECRFSNLTDIPLYCSDIKHIAKLEVNKKGIEGAAITAMAMAGASGPVDIPYTDVYETFVVDKEFGFIVTYADGVLFSGTVTNID